MDKRKMLDRLCEIEAIAKAKEVIPMPLRHVNTRNPNREQVLGHAAWLSFAATGLIVSGRLLEAERLLRSGERTLVALGERVAAVRPTLAELAGSKTVE